MVRTPAPATDRPLRKGADGRPTREALERQNFELTALLEIARGLLSAGDPGQAVGQFLLSCVAGRRKAAISSKAFITATKAGKTPMPTASSSAPKAITATMKPTEPQTRTRP